MISGDNSAKIPYSVEERERRLKDAEEALSSFKKSFKGGCITCSRDFRMLSSRLSDARRQLFYVKQIESTKRNESSKPIQSES